MPTERIQNTCLSLPKYILFHYQNTSQNTCQNTYQNACQSLLGAVGLPCFAEAGQATKGDGLSHLRFWNRRQRPVHILDALPPPRVSDVQTAVASLGSRPEG